MCEQQQMGLFITILKHHYLLILLLTLLLLRYESFGQPATNHYRKLGANILGNCQIQLPGKKVAAELDFQLVWILADRSPNIPYLKQLSNTTTRYTMLSLKWLLFASQIFLAASSGFCVDTRKKFFCDVTKDWIQIWMLYLSRHNNLTSSALLKGVG